MGALMSPAPTLPAPPNTATVIERVRDSPLSAQTRAFSARPALIVLLASLLVPSFAAAQADEAAATRLVLEAERLEASDDASGALQEYEALVARFPQSSLAPKALAAAASIQFRLGDLTAAGETAQKLVDTYSSSGEAAAGLVLQARIQIQEAGSSEDLEAALTLLKRVPNLYGRSRYPILQPRAEARVLAGELLTRLSRLGEAAASFVEAIEDEARGPHTLEAQLGLGTVLALRDQRDAAMEAFQLAIDEGLRNDTAASQEAVDRARRRLSLLYRFWVRADASGKTWLETERLAHPGGEWRKPSGVATNDRGDVLVADQNLGLTTLLADGTSSASSVRDAVRPFVGRDGAFHLVTSGAVRRLTPPATETFVSTGDKPKQLDKLIAAQQGRLGEWLLVNRGDDGIQVFSDDKTEQSVKSGDLEVLDLATDERGAVYLLSERPSRVTIHKADGSGVSVVPGPWRKPVAIDVDWLGQIYVLDAAENRIHILKENGENVLSVPATLPGGVALRSAEDLAVDESGRLIVVDPRLKLVLRLL